MPQVLRPNEYTNQRKKRATEFGIFELNKQIAVIFLTILILGFWVIASYLNKGLFFKEAAICSWIILFLIIIKTKGVKKN
tara:strand:- start:98 stop:337 length:240 start_codon:yes stop_codon:yes gene_type:complete